MKNLQRAPDCLQLFLMCNKNGGVRQCQEIFESSRKKKEPTWTKEATAFSFQVLTKSVNDRMFWRLLIQQAAIS